MLEPVLSEATDGWSPTVRRGRPALAGRWDLTVQTRLGTVAVTLQLDPGGEGTAELAGGNAPVAYVEAEGRLNIAFEVPSLDGEAPNLTLVLDSVLVRIGSVDMVGGATFHRRAAETADGFGPVIASGSVSGCRI